MQVKMLVKVDEMDELSTARLRALEIRDIIIVAVSFRVCLLCWSGFAL